MRTAVIVLTLCGCLVASRHAEVRLANNPKGADCFARCVATTEGPASVDCVAACPGAVQDTSVCEGQLACVEHRRTRKGLVTLIVIGGVLTTLALLVAANPITTDAP